MQLMVIAVKQSFFSINMAESFRIKFGKRFKELRLSRNIRQKDFAGLVGVNASFIVQLEKGQKFISPETLEKSSCILNYPIKESFNFDEMPEDKNIRIIVEKLKSNPDKLLMISRVIDAILNEQ